MDDIPEAVRESAETESKPWRTQKLLWWGVGGVGTIALVSIPLIFFFQAQSSTSSAPSNSKTASIERSASPVAPAISEPYELNDPQRSPPGEEALSSKDPALLGHFPYEEAPLEELMPIAPDGSITLRRTAAEKFLAMLEAAKADGVIITPLSGFRSVAEQEQVFFEVKAERGQNTTQRAEVSAPPGYSEHHTGYAIDVGDGYFPDTNLQPSFERTRTFQWLQQNAAFYSFEMSFPQGNAQGVNYEPWHWRYVGDRTSLETFYRAKNLNPQEEFAPSPGS
ncbi:MAG: D-alanyl-D-alanine carboxypeptidase family protein [Cyanobacteria bacterium CRU_2_1]|nr:D-alanyl-D-alanine carboxypeptidase family protein [Cyanobacteria bacterium RU_5_0]NJR58902.1 D-alanyl-D-alanine carboxypeptidase family protein [Cyanobacteria bacterium CRU_2_1]